MFKSGFPVAEMMMTIIYRGTYTIRISCIDDEFSDISDVGTSSDVEKDL